MDKFINAIIALVVAVLVAAGVSAVTLASVSNDINTDVQNAVKSTQTVGALAGPDIASPYLKWGSIPTYNEADNMRLATTTVCSYGPFIATSTLQDLTLQVTGATSSAETLDVATSTGPAATSTSNTIMKAVLGANAQGTFTYDPTALNQNIIGKGLYLLVMSESPVGPSFPAGTCEEQHQRVGVY